MFMHLSSSGQDSAVHLHLKEKGHSFEDSKVHILDREDRWFGTGIREAIYVKLEKTSLNRGGALRFHLPRTCNTALFLLPRQFHNHSHLGSCDQTSPFQAGRQFRGDNDSHDMHIGQEVHM